MEKKFYTDDFEQLLKEKSDQFRMYPSKRVWHSIYNDLHPGRKWPSVAMSMMLILALLLIGYFNTSDSTIIRQIADNTAIHNSTEPSDHGITTIKNQSPRGFRNQPPVISGSWSSSRADISNPTETAGSSISFIKAVDPGINYDANSITGNNASDKKPTTDREFSGNKNGKDLVQTVDRYIRTNQIFRDLAAINKKDAINKKKNTKTGKQPLANNTSQETTDQEDLSDQNAADHKNNVKEFAIANSVNIIPVATSVNSLETNKLSETDKLNIVKEDEAAKTSLNAGNKSLSPEDKAWIENYAMNNRSAHNKWKGRTAIEFHVTPSMNYRNLSTETKGSAAPFANTNINNFISQKPGLGLEAGIGLAYAFAKNIRFKAGLQFNYTSYRINADETNHPVLTSLLLNDLNTGYSYTATRTSTLANVYNSSALQPVIVHNSTYQVSIPVGLAFKLASNRNIDWFAGASIQPTFVFGGNAHLISADLRDYISEPSSIRNWNLNTGIETYINYKLGGFTLQAGPQVRYQLFSTYRKTYTSVEKQYAIGLKIGIVKGF